ncbi:hypothetical protein S101446_01732 [Komagataeibacter europaeus]|nr:hypothetical protein S101446_01732 [Komagataeibacter europaeus]
MLAAHWQQLHCITTDRLPSQTGRFPSRKPVRKKSCRGAGLSGNVEQNPAVFMVFEDSRARPGAVYKY